MVSAPVPACTAWVAVSQERSSKVNLTCLCSEGEMLRHVQIGIVRSALEIQIAREEMELPPRSPCFLLVLLPLRRAVWMQLLSITSITTTFVGKEGSESTSLSGTAKLLCPISQSSDRDPHPWHWSSGMSISPLSDRSAVH